MYKPECGISYYDSPVGRLALLSESGVLTGLYTGNGKHSDVISKYDLREVAISVISDTKEWLDIYFSGGKPDFMPMMRTSGTAFQESVWALLKEIPYGFTTTYGDIAKKLAERRNKVVSAQAVGGAVGRNPISIIIPCHRVIGRDGNLTGYAGGLDVKEYLLSIENQHL